MRVRKKHQIIVTGGLGFVGSHLVKRLIAANYYPIIIDNLSVGDKKILKSFLQSKFYFIKCDILNRKKLEESLAKFSPETIVHLAAFHFVPYCAQHPGETVWINTFGTKTLLEIAIQRDVKNFLFISSGAVYKPGAQPHKETDYLEPIDIYGLSKKMAEEAVQFYTKYNGIKFIILRLFNTYGPGEFLPHFIPKVLLQLENSDQIKVGNVHTYRDYIYIADVVDAIMKILKSSRGFDNSIYNIGTGKKHSGHALLQILSELMNRRITFHIDRSLIRKLDRKVMIADISKFCREYSWSPQYSIYQGLSELIRKR